ncbi:CBS domain-containing protein [Streptomyces sp. MUM 178J]|uniref:CBS domain-containing protein n=1 Tax=Streptomyces sp. MUM 178J TaxID=2791991 RepID=UPI001F03D5B3|nr:CBS domain-containing protein [Streptomyces sp. MUM 178J]WRQ82357.1 CBS domain-containing protein [Streptomyces sp. MUM 178J]
MLAHDLAEPYPSVTTDDPASDAARLLAEKQLPALLVLDADGQPYAIVPGSQLVRQLVPEYVMEDPLLASVIGDRHEEGLIDAIADLTVAEWLPRRAYSPPFVGPDAGALQVAALMARTHSPLVAVIERDAQGVRLLGAITAARLVRHFLNEGDGPPRPEPDGPGA